MLERVSRKSGGLERRTEEEGFDRIDDCDVELCSV